MFLRLPARKPVPDKGTKTLIVSALAMAGALAASAVVNRYLARKAEKDHPPVGEFITVRGLPLHYIDRGSGPTVVMLHGNGSALQDFICSGLVDQLTAKHRVIVFDRPGFGHTGRPDRGDWTPDGQAGLLAEALVKLGVEEPVLLGHSWGTLVAIALAQEARLRCKGLVLVSGYYLPKPRMDLLLGSLGALPLLGPLLCNTILPFKVRAAWPSLVRSLFAPRSAQSFADFPKSLAFRPSQISANAEETAMLNPAVEGLAARARTLRLPITFLAGTGDQVVDADHSAALHRRSPGSTIQLLPLQGHMLHHTASGRVIAAIEALGDCGSESPAHAKADAS